MFTIFGCDVSCWQIWANVATAVTGLTTVVGMTAIIITLLATKSQLNEMARGRSLTAFFEISRLMESGENWRLRKFLYELSGAPGHLEDADQEKLEQSIRHMNYVAYLTNKEFFPLNDFLELYFGVIVKFWKKAEPYVEHERKKRGLTMWVRYLEWLAEQAELYRVKHYPDADIVIYPATKVQQAGM